MDRESISKFYKTDKYIEKHPSLHEEDSPWKVTKIIPMVDLFIKNHCDGNEINVLDVGGGAGLILKSISAHIQERHGIKVNKFVLDLSPGMLKIQKRNNPDIKGVFNEDITKVSLRDKEMDLVLMIDVIEHVSEPLRALKELRRISKFTIFKVPLEDNSYCNILNFLSRGKFRRNNIETSGHINVYNLSKLRNQIEANAGTIADYYFTNVFSCYLNPECYKGRISLFDRLYYLVASLTYKLSPRLCSYIFTDFVILLVKAK